MAPTAAKKAPEYPAGYVKEAADGVCFVRSRSIDGAWWAVVNNRCGCPARVANCWHVRRVADFYEALEDKPAPRPLGLVKPSMFVD